MKTVPGWIAKILSLVFHPVFCPPYAIWLFCYAEPSFSSWLMMSLIILSLLPLVATGIYLKMQSVKEYYRVDIQHRKIPFYISFISILIFGVFLVIRSETHSIVADFLLIYAFVILAGFIVTIGFRYKISLHLIGWGAMLGMSLTFDHVYPHSAWYFLLVASALYWARFTLRIHTHSELLLGYATGFLVSFIAMTLIPG